MCYVSDADNVSNNNESIFRNRFLFGNNANYINTSYTSYMCNVSNAANVSNESKFSIERNFSYKSSNKNKKGKRICKGLKISVMGVISTSSIKSSRSQMFFKVGVLKNFAIFTGKHMCKSLFLIKLKTCNFIKKRLQQVFYRTFLNLFLRTPILKSILIGCFCNKGNECNISYERNMIFR